jgi:hypothetical protein
MFLPPKDMLATTGRDRNKIALSFEVGTVIPEPVRQILGPR